MVKFNAVDVSKIFILLTCMTFLDASSLEHDGWLNINLLHSLTGGEKPVFTERGNISVQSIRIGQAVVNQRPLTPSESIQLRDLAANNQFYQIKAIVTDGDGQENTFLSTVKACMLAEAALDDRLSVSLDFSGKVIGVSIIIASNAACEGSVVSVSKLKQFTTSVYIRHTENGPVPDTATYIQRLEREKDAKDRGEGKDNRSFLAKYWMYIVPVVLIMAISSATNPEGGGNAAAK